MINKILLTDEVDTFYTDLITFNRDTTKKEVYEIIAKCQHDKATEYTNEDIYEYLDKYIGIKDIVFLGNYDTFYY